MQHCCTVSDPFPTPLPLNSSHLKLASSLQLSCSSLFCPFLLLLSLQCVHSLCQYQLPLVVPRCRVTQVQLCEHNSTTVHIEHTATCMFSLTMLMLKTSWMMFFLFLLNISLSTTLTSNEVTINVAERFVEQSTINTLMLRATFKTSLMSMICV